MVGAAAAMDIAAGGTTSVTVADASASQLAILDAAPGVQPVEADLANRKVLSELVATQDLVIAALPSVLGFRTLEAVLDAGRPIVDISFTRESALVLDPLARERGVAAVVDCGIAPGLSHMLTGFAATKLEPCDRVSIYVGGLPVDRCGPLEYKAGFSPGDVIEEYVRPARVVEHGRVVVKDALSEPEIVEVEGVGALEGFLTDGLRTLCETLPARFMVEKTLRYPGHRRIMEILRDVGFFSAEAVTIEGGTVRPVDVATALLSAQWKFGSGEEDVTVLRVSAEGRLDGEPTRLTWNLVDRFDRRTGLRSMSRTTAFTATAVARLLLAGRFPPGVHPPETIGSSGMLDAVLTDLGARGIHCPLAVEAL